MTESRVVKIEKNIIAAFMQNILNCLLMIVSRIIFVRILDADYLGINGLFSNILNILSLADMGMGTAMMYNLYKPIADGDTRTINALISFFRKIYLGIALSILFVGMVLIPFLGYIIRVEKNITHLEAYYIMALLNVVTSYLFVYRTTLLTADQKSYILNRYIMLFKIVTFVMQTIILLSTRNYFLYLLTALIINIFSNITQNFVTLKIYPFLKERSIALDEQGKEKVKRDVKSTFLYKICGTVQSNTDSILISIFSGTVFVGYYSNYLMIVTAAISVLTLIFSSMKASVGNMIASTKAPQKESMFYFRVAELINFWLVGFCCISFICLFQDFIQLLFGKQYVLDFPVVVAIVANFYTGNIRQTIWVFRETTGLFRETRYVTAVTAVLNFCLSWIFGYFWGVTGIVAATVIARLIYAWWKEPFVLFHNFFERNPFTYYVTYMKRVCLCVIACIVTYIICRLFSGYNLYLNFVKRILTCLTVPNFLFFICFYRTPEFKYIREKLTALITHRLKRKE